MEKSKDSACGPIDRSLLFMQEDHISTSIWEGDDRLRFDVRQYTTCMDKWVLDDEQRHLLDSWGFGVFAHPQVVRQNDIAREWRPETNTFHFPFGEITITLEDVYMLMGLPISGRALTFMDLATPQQYWLTQWEDLRLEKGPVRKKKSDKKKKKKKSKWKEKSEREKMWS
ncbi:protein MAIN-LIKE 1-like [Daucus carota subsp. sativus]|uniref:protein MAIN-LIKE 1-like n=1 Tax=Daucus carota subsp. sativus TaxID=79200 RepID=UPI0030834EC2